jgi:ABC-2 type transport system permease protein
VKGDGLGQIVATGSERGSIYDLGYRRYEGRRLGRRHAVASLVRESFRQSFGLGRPARAKIIPVGLFVLAMLPAVVALGVAAIANQAGAPSGSVPEPVTYENYYSLVAQIVVLFAAAQAPELLGRDMRYRVLTLYFARAMRREDYALAKLAAIGIAMILFVVVPQAIVFAGRSLVATDIPASVRRDLPDIVPVVAQALLTAALLGSVALAVASFTPRRAFATAGIIIVLIVPPAIVAIVEEIAGSDVAGPLSLLSPPNILEASNAWFFGSPLTGSLDLGIPAGAYPIAGVVLSVVAAAVLVIRYRTIEP